MANIEDMTQEDIDRMEAALERYKTENKKFREQRDEFKAQAEAGEANEAFKNRALAAEAKLRLNGLGVKDTDRLTKYIDYSKVSFGENDEIIGLDEQIEGLKGDFAEVFDPKRRVGGKADAAASTPPATPKTTTEMQLANLFGE